MTLTQQQEELLLALRDEKMILEYRLSLVNNQMRDLARKIGCSSFRVVVSPVPEGKTKEDVVNQ